MPPTPHTPHYPCLTCWQDKCANNTWSLKVAMLLCTFVLSAPPYTIPTPPAHNARTSLLNTSHTSHHTSPTPPLHHSITPPMFHFSTRHNTILHASPITPPLHHISHLHSHTTSNKQPLILHNATSLTTTCCLLFQLHLKLQ